LLAGDGEGGKGVEGRGGDRGLWVGGVTGSVYFL
jgi:hypothetical protein